MNALLQCLFHILQFNLKLIRFYKVDEFNLTNCLIELNYKYHSYKFKERSLDVFNIKNHLTKYKENIFYDVGEFLLDLFEKINRENENVIESFLQYSIESSIECNNCHSLIKKVQRSSKFIIYQTMI